MPKTEAQQRATRKWDAQHMTQVKVGMRREEADAFKARCAENGTTPSAVLREAIQRYMEEK